MRKDGALRNVRNIAFVVMVVLSVQMLSAWTYVSQYPVCESGNSMRALANSDTCDDKLDIWYDACTTVCSTPDPAGNPTCEVLPSLNVIDVRGYCGPVGGR